MMWGFALYHDRFRAKCFLPLLLLICVFNLFNGKGRFCETTMQRPQCVFCRILLLPSRAFHPRNLPCNLEDWALSFILITVSVLLLAWLMFSCVERVTFTWTNWKTPSESEMLKWTKQLNGACLIVHSLFLFFRNERSDLLSDIPSFVWHFCSCSFMHRNAFCNQTAKCSIYWCRKCWILKGLNALFFYFSFPLQRGEMMLPEVIWNLEKPNEKAVGQVMCLCCIVVLICHVVGDIFAWWILIAENVRSLWYCLFRHQNYLFCFASCIFIPERVGLQMVIPFVVTLSCGWSADVM